MTKERHRYNDGKKRHVTSTYMSDDTFAAIEEYRKKQGLKSTNRAISKLVNNHLDLYNRGLVKEQIHLKRSSSKSNIKS